MKKKIMFWLFFAIALIVSICTIIWMVSRYQSTNHKTEAIIIEYDSEYGGVLAVTKGAQGTQGYSLFTFGYKPDEYPITYENETYPAIGEAPLRTGMTVILTGSDLWQYTYPYGYPGVTKITVTGQREDFIAKYFDDFVERYANASFEELAAAINALTDLNEGEKEGLHHLVWGELN